MKIYRRLRNDYYDAYRNTWKKYDARFKMNRNELYEQVKSFKGTVILLNPHQIKEVYNMHKNEAVFNLEYLEETEYTKEKHPEYFL